MTSISTICHKCMSVGSSLFYICPLIWHPVDISNIIRFVHAQCSYEVIYECMPDGSFSLWIVNFFLFNVNILKNVYLYDGEIYGSGSFNSRSCPITWIMRLAWIVHGCSYIEYPTVSFFLVSKLYFPFMSNCLGIVRSSMNLK